MVTDTKIETYVLELTNRCNESCDFCYSISYNSLSKKPRVGVRLGFNEWASALEGMVKNGARAIDFSGGEPTMHPEFAQILQKAKSLELFTIVSTNGSSYNNENIKDALNSYADCIALSIHGNEEKHDRLKHKKGSYQKVSKAFYDLIKRGKKVKVNTVVCKESREDIKEIGSNLDVNNANFQWKLSQAVSREAGRINRANTSVSNNEFNDTVQELKTHFSKAYNEGRLTFREDDSQLDRYQFVPYIIASSNGLLHIPIGEEHVNLGISLLDPDYYQKLNAIFENLKNLPYEINKNHQKFYGGQ